MLESLSIIHFNTQGFQNKVENINNFVKVHKPDILVLTEHFQKKPVDLEQIEGYKIVNSFCRKHNERGGVAIWAKNHIPCTPRKDLDRHRKEREFELVSVSVGEDFVVTGAYRPPSTSIPDFHGHLERFIRKINREPHVKHVLTGDFNVDNGKPNTTRDVLSENDLRFHLTSGTHKHGGCLDNFITNFEAVKSRVIKSKSSRFSDHHPIEIIVHKEAEMIADKTNNSMYKFFQKVFENKNPKLQKTPAGGQKYAKKTTPSSTPQSKLVEIFAKVFNLRNITSPFTKANSSANKTQSKTTQKTATDSQPSQVPQDSSGLYKVFKAIIPNWLKPQEASTKTKTLNRTSRKKAAGLEKELEVEPTSFFSKIRHYFDFILKFFKSTPTQTVPPKKQSKKNTRPLSEPNSTKPSSLIYKFFSLLF